MLVDSTLNTLKDKERHQCLVIANTYLIVHDQITIRDMQCAVSIEIDVVAHLHISLSTCRNCQACYLHITLLVEVYGNLNLYKSLLGIDSSLILTIQHKLLNQAFSAHVDATRMIVVAG